MKITPQTIRLDHVTVDYGSGPVVRDLDVKLEAGNLTALLGPSGCGKTTTLRVIAGLLLPSAGHVYFDTEDVTDLPPWQRRLGLVFQRHALFPHLTVLENVMYGLAGRGTTRQSRRSRARDMLSLTHIEGLADRMPSELSGGQSQRVALARALAPEPRLLLLDEPFSALDADLRERLRTEVAAIVRDVGVTTLLVTHDQREALSMADQVIVMENGVIMEHGSPHDVYHRPRSVFGAQFVGNSNILPSVARDPDRPRVTDLAAGSSRGVAPPQTLTAIKPEDVRVDPLPEEVDCRMEAALLLERYEGSNHESLWEIPGLEGTVVRAAHRSACGYQPGQTATLGWRERDVRVVTPQPA